MNALQKMMENVLRYLELCADFFLYVGERFDKKVKVNLKIYDVATWLIKNYETHNVSEEVITIRL